MNCSDVAAILDEHALSRLSAPDRCALDEHVTSCDACAFAWHAQDALVAQPVPAAAANLLDTVLRAVSTRQAQAPRRARTRVVLVGALLAAGAALAAATLVRMLERAGEQSPPVNSRLGDSRDSRPASAQPARAAPQAVGSDAETTAAVAVEEIQSEYVMAIVAAPNYPPAALEHKLEGDVTVEYTIDDRGAVRNARAVRSSDPLFEASALAAITQWKYLPRVIAGKRVATVGVRSVLRFQLLPSTLPSNASAGDAPPKSQGKPGSTLSSARPGENAASATTPALTHPLDFATLDRSIAVVWQRAADGDLRGAELELDELRATYDLDDRQGNKVWGFYAYIYTQYGDYGRAIDAYEKAVALDTAGWSNQWISLANLYFARHQYDMALKTLLAYKQRSTSGRIDTRASEMIERLRALGVTEQTL